MKLNNKGFTLVELLAVVSLIAILSGLAITAYTSYLEKARKESYEAMEKSAFSAAQNYIQATGAIVPVQPSERTIDVSTLVDKGYLKNLEDPRSKGEYCHSGSTVKVSKKKSSGTTLEEYTYTVTIKCNGYTSTRVEGGTTKTGKIFKS